MMINQVQYRIYVEDTDMMGIVYHSNYLNFFERARTDWLRILGIFLTDLAKDDTYFAIRNLAIEYKHPLRLDDLIQIDTYAKSIGFCQIQFMQKMFNQVGIEVSSAVIDVVCVNQNMRPRKIPSRVTKELIE